MAECMLRRSVFRGECPGFGNDSRGEAEKRKWHTFSASTSAAPSSRAAFTTRAATKRRWPRSTIRRSPVRSAGASATCTPCGKRFARPCARCLSTAASRPRTSKASASPRTARDSMRSIATGNPSATASFPPTTAPWRKSLNGGAGASTGRPIPMRINRYGPATRCRFSPGSRTTRPARTGASTAS